MLRYVVPSPQQEPEGLGLGRVPWRGGLDEVGDDVPDTHGDQLSTARVQWLVVVGWALSGG